MRRQTIATNRTKSKYLTTAVPINEARVHIHAERTHVHVPLRDRSTRSRGRIRKGADTHGDRNARDESAANHRHMPRHGVHK